MILGQTRSSLKLYAKHAYSTTLVRSREIPKPIRRTTTSILGLIVAALKKVKNSPAISPNELGKKKRLKHLRTNGIQYITKAFN